jgi:hypothetical protein
MPSTLYVLVLPPKRNTLPSLSSRAALGRSHTSSTFVRCADSRSVTKTLPPASRVNSAWCREIDRCSSTTLQLGARPTRQRCPACRTRKGHKYRIISDQITDDEKQSTFILLVASTPSSISGLRLGRWQEPRPSTAWTALPVETRDLGKTGRQNSEDQMRRVLAFESATWRVPIGLPSRWTSSTRPGGRGGAAAASGWGSAADGSVLGRFRSRSLPITKNNGI